MINKYLYGSRVYGNYNSNSDYDYIVVDTDLKEDFQEILGNDNISYYTLKTFRDKLENHSMEVLECYFLPDNLKTEEIKFDFNLDLIKLRHSVSHNVSNSWLRCKKKLILENEDSYIGIKSLFHSFRILDFAIQIAKYKKNY